MIICVALQQTKWWASFFNLGHNNAVQLLAIMLPIMDAWFHAYLFITQTNCCPRRHMIIPLTSMDVTWGASLLLLCPTLQNVSHILVATQRLRQSQAKEFLRRRRGNKRSVYLVLSGQEKKWIMHCRFPPWVSSMDCERWNCSTASKSAHSFRKYTFVMHFKSCIQQLIVCKCPMIAIANSTFSQWYEKILAFPKLRKMAAFYFAAGINIERIVWPTHSLLRIRNLRSQSLFIHKTIVF